MRKMTLETLTKWADWEDIYNDLQSLREYWEQQPTSTEQLQNVAVLKITLNLINDVIKAGEA